MAASARAAVVVCGLIVCGASARADEGSPPTAELDPDSEVAQRAFQEGINLYSLGRYEEAAAAFQRANAAQPRAAFDYNTARAYDRLGRWADALRLYERYLAAPDAARDPGVGETRARVEQLRGRVAPTVEKPPAAATVTTPIVQPAKPPDGSRRGRGERISGVAMMIAGVALAATGIAFGVLAQQASDSITAANRDGGSYDSQRWASGQNDQLAEAVLLAVGATVAVAGAVLYAVGVRAGRAIALTPMRNGGAAIQVRF